MTTYSFKDTTGAFEHPNVGEFQFAGQIGMGEFVVVMAQERTSHDIAADGNVMVSYLAGDNGSLDIQVQQTSALHAFLLAWFNTVKTAADNQDVANWAAATVTLRSLVDGSTHVLTGVSPSKIPDKTYAAQGGKVTWRLMAADVQSVVLGV
jgi:hypothetical protein